jgi:hypothetical protein
VHARSTALSHAVVCRRRYLSRNKISTIASGTFAGLTALTQLYGAGLLALLLTAWCWYGSEALRGGLRPYSMTFFVLLSHFSLAHAHTLSFLGTIAPSPFPLIFAFCLCVCVCGDCGGGFYGYQRGKDGENDSVANFHMSINKTSTAYTLHGIIAPFPFCFLLVCVFMGVWIS